MNDLEIYTLDNFETKESDNFLLGSFESFHLGHYQLYQEALKHPGRIILVTFQQDSFDFKNKGKYFQSNHANYFNLAQLNIDCVIELDFAKVRSCAALEFLNKLSNKKLIKVFVGQDFIFGSDRLRATELDLSNNSLIDLQIVEIFKFKNQKISTSLLKESLEFGDLDLINDLLVYNFTIDAIYHETKLLVNQKQLLMHPGIYLTILYLDDLAYLSLTHVSLQKELFCYLLSSELNLLKDLKEKKCYVEFLTKQRLIISSSQDQLTKEDYQVAKNYLVNLKNA